MSDFRITDKYGQTIGYASERTPIDHGSVYERWSDELKEKMENDKQEREIRQYRESLQLEISQKMNKNDKEKMYSLIKQKVCSNSEKIELRKSISRIKETSSHLQILLAAFFIIWVIVEFFMGVYEPLAIIKNLFVKPVGLIILGCILLSCLILFFIKKTEINKESFVATKEREEKAAETEVLQMLKKHDIAPVHSIFWYPPADCKYFEHL